MHIVRDEKQGRVFGCHGQGVRNIALLLIVLCYSSACSQVSVSPGEVVKAWVNSCSSANLVTVSHPSPGRGSITSPLLTDPSPFCQFPQPLW